MRKGNFGERGALGKGILRGGGVAEPRFRRTHPTAGGKKTQKVKRGKKRVVKEQEKQRGWAAPAAGPATARSFKSPKSGLNPPFTPQIPLFRGAPKEGGAVGNLAAGRQSAAVTGGRNWVFWGGG